MQGSWMKKSLKHIAIIMDGNGRWASQRGLSRTEGHQAGVKALKSLLYYCLGHKKDLEVLTVFAFSRENWRRPKQEVDFLIQLFANVLKSEVHFLHEKGVKLCFIGDRQGLSQSLREAMHDAEQLTADNTNFVCMVAINYSGRWDIMQAMQSYFKHFLAYTDLSKAKDQEVLLKQDMTSETLKPYLALGSVGDPDLLIRTSGEKRLSNFSLWNLAYTEFYFTSTYWPDFTPPLFEEARQDYFSRQRRFGLIDKQVSEKKKGK